MHFPFPPDTVHFNPRFREGSDFVCRGKSGGLGDFNPRSREGSDKDAVDIMGDWNISIHAPAKGATDNAKLFYKGTAFQSTLPRRERQHLLTSFRLQYGYFYFISPIKYSSCFKKIN